MAHIDNVRDPGHLWSGCRTIMQLTPGCHHVHEELHLRGIVLTLGTLWKRLRGVVLPLWSALAFALVYPQSRLFTSNQNSYFLHGLQHALNLHGDWQTQSVDAQPVFSWLVATTYNWFGYSGFYLLYGALTFVYAWSLSSIYIFCSRSEHRHEAAACAVLAWGVLTIYGWKAFDWLNDGFAGQYLLATYLQPCTFGVLILAGLAAATHKRWRTVAMCLASAAVVHPTYLPHSALVGLAIIVHLIWRAGNRRSALLFAAVLAGFTLPIVVYVLVMFTTDSATALEGANILVHRRIPHHALAERWVDGRVIFLGCFATATAVLLRRNVIGLAIGLALLLGVALQLVQVLTASPRLALLFPLRSSVWFVPLTTFLASALIWDVLGRGVQAGVRFYRQSTAKGTRADYGAEATPRWLFLLMGASILFCSVALVVHKTPRMVNLLRSEGTAQADSGWVKAAQRFVDAQKGVILLLPGHLRADVRLGAGRSIYVDRKTHPFRGDEVVEWQRRLSLADRIFRRRDLTALRKLHQDGVTHVLTSQDWPPIEDLSAGLVFRDRRYAMIDLNKAFAVPETTETSTTSSVQ